MKRVARKKIGKDLHCGYKKMCYPELGSGSRADKLFLKRIEI